MYKVVGSDGQVYGLVDTREQALAIVEMKKLGKDGKPVKSAQNATKASGMTFRVEECADSVHPGHDERRS